MHEEHYSPTRLRWRKSLEPDDLNPRDYLCLVLRDLDYEAQLQAIHYLLARNHEADKEMRDEIQRIEQHARIQSGILEPRNIDLRHLKYLNLKLK